MTQQPATPDSLSGFLRSLWTPDLRLALLLCMPGVVVALGLRLWLTYHMPYGFVHGDTAQQAVTGLKLVEQSIFEIDQKKTFLTPLLYSLPALADIPVLYFSAALQHFFGVLLVMIIGLLTKAWLPAWRLWIVPLTFLIAIDPILLWYEHVALPESLMVFGTVSVAAAGTFFYRRPNRYTLALLFLAALFVAGARPEGHFIALFALALVIRRLWGEWSRLKIYGPISTLCVLLIFLVTRTSQSGILLYASLIHLSPPHLATAPGLAEMMQPFQARAIQGENRSRKHIKLRKDMASAMTSHLETQGLTGRALKAQISNTFQQAGIEIAIRNFWRLPELAVEKFFIGHNEPPAMGFGQYVLSGQIRSLYVVNGGKHVLELSRLLWGVPLATSEEARPFIEANYDTAAGDSLTTFLDWFVAAEAYTMVPMEIPGARLRGIPLLYVCALLGAFCLILRERPAFGLQLIWFLALCAIFIVVMVTGNVRARYRIIFEPFWFVYLFALFDTLVAIARRATTGAPLTVTNV